MSNELAPFVAAVLRDRTVDELHSENQRLRQENQHLLQRNSTLVQQQHYTIIRSSSNTSHFYVTGAKDPQVLYQQPFTWFDVEEQIELHPADPIIACPVQEIDEAQLRIGGQIMNFRNADRTMLRGFDAGPNGGLMIEYFYIWENNQFASNVEIIVSVVFGPVLDWQQRGLRIQMADPHMQCHPNRFGNDEIESVRFDHVSFVANFGSDEEDEDDE